MPKPGMPTGVPWEIDAGLPAIGSAESNAGHGALPSRTPWPGRSGREPWAVDTSTACGQADFSGAAAHAVARSLIALRSTAGGPMIVRCLHGQVTTACADAAVVATEPGTAWLRELPLSARAGRPVAAGAPEHRGLRI